jgi:sulfocyanin
LQVDGVRKYLATITPLFTLLIVACGGSNSASPASSPSQATTPSASAGILAFDASAKTVTIELLAGHSGGGFNFNGFSNGRLKITVPENWRVTVKCTNQATTNHSCAIVAGQSDTAPAFPGAATPNPVAGLGQGQSASFSFTPDKVGTFRIVCLVPGHEGAGMWDAFVVIADGTPSVAT